MSSATANREKLGRRLASRFRGPTEKSSGETYKVRTDWELNLQARRVRKLVDRLTSLPGFTQNHHNPGIIVSVLRSATVRFCNMRPLLCLLVIWLAASVQAATTYISETGPNGGNVTVEPSQFMAESWTQTVTLTNIQILADLAAAGGLPTGIVYLTNAIGNGTTSGANQVAINASAPFTAGATPAFQTLFTGLTLGPGTYYLVITGPGPNPSDNNFWEAASPPTLVTATGVTYNALFQGSGTTSETQSGYAPSSSFASLGNAITLQFMVSSGVPEPASYLLMASGLLAFAAAKRLSRDR
jgi:hypothetical protein